MEIGEELTWFTTTLEFAEFLKVNPTPSRAHLKISEDLVSEYTAERVIPNNILNLVKQTPSISFSYSER